MAFQTACISVTEISFNINHLCHRFSIAEFSDFEMKLTFFAKFFLFLFLDFFAKFYNFFIRLKLFFYS